MQIRKPRFYSSFPTRLTVTIISVVGAVLIIGAYSNYRSAVSYVYEQSLGQMQSSLSNTVLRIDNVLQSVENAVNNLSWTVQAELDDPELMYEITRHVIESNDFVMGSAIAFEPSYYKKLGQFYSPYSYRSEDQVLSKQLGNDNYDYHYMDWYQIPKLLQKSYWSEPYYDDGGGNVIMTTYSKPIYDEDGNFVAIFTADVSLESFADQINEYKPYPSSYNMLVGRGGAYLMHMDKESILNETIFSEALATDSDRAVELGHRIISGEPGLEFIEYDGMERCIIYAPVVSTGWSIIVSCSQDDIIAGVDLMRKITTIVGVIALVLMAVLCFVSIRTMTKPLVAFAQSAKDIAHGNFNAKLPAIESEDEMKVLHDSFEYMQESLTNYVEELKATTATKAGIESELHIARVIQMSMVPKVFPPFPDRNDIDVYAHLIPAKEVGGDLYDFFIENDKLYFIVGDVSGKGVPASLVMAVTSRLFHSIAAKFDDPTVIVHALNNSLSEGNDANMFCTAFIGILDLKTGHMKYCNAGHNPPVIKRNGVSEYLSVIPNLPLGVWYGFDYKGQECHLDKGSMILAYSDGITEAVSVDNRLYSDSRLLDYLRNDSSQDARALADSVLEDVNRHAEGADQSDDITLMCINYMDKSDNETSMKITLRNEIEEIGRMTSFVEEVCERKNAGPKDSFNIRLALEEAVTNVIMYAFPQGETHEFDLTVKEEGDRLTFIITDSGKEFDPTAAAEPDITLSAEERPIGGLGIFLIRRIMDSVEYRREDGRNVLTMVKTLNKE